MIKNQAFSMHINEKNTSKRSWN